MPGVLCDLNGGAPNTKRGERVGLSNQLILLVFF
jgi:hypothetical protein